MTSVKPMSDIESPHDRMTAVKAMSDSESPTSEQESAESSGSTKQPLSERVTYQSMFMEHMRLLEQQSLTAFTVMHVAAVAVTAGQALRGKLPWAVPAGFFAGLSIAILHRFFKDHHLIRPAMFFYILGGACLSTVLPYLNHQRDAPLASLCIHIATPMMLRTNFYTVQSLLGFLAVFNVYHFSQSYPELTPAFASCFFVSIIAALNQRMLCRHMIYERYKRLQSDEVTMKKQQALLQLQSNDHLAMRRLYHVVKNVLVGVAGVLEQPDELTADERAVCASSLRQGIDFILHRTAFSALAAGNYQSQRQRAVFSEFFDGLAVPPTVERCSRGGVLTVLAGSFETLLFRCALVDSIANALSHGAAGSVRVEYWVEDEAMAAPANPLHIDNDAAMLRAGVYNRLKPGAPPLTCERVAELFEDGATHGGGCDNSGMGLSSVRFMLQSLGGDLELKQSAAGEVACLLSIPVDVVHDVSTTPAAPCATAAAAKHLSRGSSDTAIEDCSRAPAVTTSSKAPPAFASLTIATAVDEATTTVASPSGVPTDGLLRVVTVEDSPLINKLYRRLLPSQLGVPSTNVRVLASEYEARHAVDEVLAFRPGVVVLDQNIDFVASAGVCYYGTKISRELRERGTI